MNLEIVRENTVWKRLSAPSVIGKTFGGTLVKEQQALCSLFFQMLMVHLFYGVGQK